MKAQIIQIGNSQGIRIPKTLLEETGVAGEIELEAHADGILIRNINKPRGDWESKFKAAAETDDDHILDANQGSTFEKQEWQW